MTPRQLMALRHEYESEAAERRVLVAMLQRDLINFSFCRPKEPVRLEDLLPAGLLGARARAPRTRLTRRRARAIVASIEAFFAKRGA